MPVEGASKVTAAFDRLADEVQRDLRAEASRTGQRIAAAAARRLRERTHGTGLTADNIVSEDGEDDTRVFVRPIPQRPANLPQWLEFGTMKMGARPFLFPAARDEQDGFRRRAEQILARTVERVVRD